MLENRVGILDFWTSHGKEFMMRTPWKNYYIVWKECEIDEVLEMMEEIALLVEAHRVVNINKN